MDANPQTKMSKNLQGISDAWLTYIFKWGLQVMLCSDWGLICFSFSECVTFGLPTIDVLKLNLGYLLNHRNLKLTLLLHLCLSATGTFCVGAENEPDGAPEDWMRIAELQARNKACLPHLKSSYPVEFDVRRKGHL